MNIRFVALLLGGFFTASIPAFSQVPSDTEIRKMLSDRVGAANNGNGIVVGVVDANGRRVIAYGSLAKNDNRKLDGDTVFEIGSMTKVFTSLVLLDMARRGEVALTDPIAKYLPASVGRSQFSTSASAPLCPTASRAFISGVRVIRVSFSPSGSHTRARTIAS